MPQSIFLACASLLIASPALTQQTHELGVAVAHPEVPKAHEMGQSTRTALRLISSNRPRWQNAALIGAVAGGASFAIMHVMFSGWNPQPKSMANDLAIGFLGGAAVAGGSVAFYDWVCAPGSASDDAGLCSSLPVRRFPDGTRSGGMKVR